MTSTAWAFVRHAPSGSRNDAATLLMPARL
jgi:hypothetical protein